MRDSENLFPFKPLQRTAPEDGFLFWKAGEVKPSSILVFLSTEKLGTQLLRVPPGSSPQVNYFTKVKQ